ncbi:hypothetical protein GJ744_008287 [Endocarpon pusillum]|uniref:HAUS augmin-like complex subunit 6 N-terminal domain-containing protein n=1 Tax=Endocarpon pusillum TaxID=364733 RepID=A0A8H7ALN9_9EURO|nr:hypothetical protein GJ744_008287 [Endocarpon pusillum]
MPVCSKTQTADVPAPNWAGPSNIVAFLRCLRLLDLDLLDDWPVIHKELFSVKAAQPNLQQRVKCVEWSLYRLFETWDPTYTKDKLRPFFPPLAPLQSINLRAALYRGLTELKKNGILGKEVILRKTMLDECKGDKLEEVLRVFTMAILRKEACRRLHSVSPTPTRYVEVLTAPEDLSIEQRQRLLPLVLAHRINLKKQLNERRRIDGEFRNEMRHLDDARAKLREKREMVLARQGKLPNVTQEKLEAISDDVQAAWTGNEQWAEVLLHGGLSDLELPLTRNSVRDGAQQICSTTENEPLSCPPNNLLADLNERIEKHRSRLRKWTEFRDSLEKSQKDPRRETPVQTRKPILDFSAHQELRPGMPRNESVVSTEPVLQAPSYHSEVIEAMRAELANLREYNSPREVFSTKSSSQYHVKSDVQQKHNSTGTVSNTEEPPLEGKSGVTEIFRGDDTIGQSNHQAGEYGVWQQDILKHRDDYFSQIQWDDTEGTSPIQDTHIAQQPSEPSRARVPNNNVEQSKTTLSEASKCHFIESSVVQLHPVSRNRYDDEVSSPTFKEGRLRSSAQPRQLLQNQITPQQSTDPIPTASEPDIFSANPPSPSPPKPTGTSLLERTRQSMALLPSSTDTAPINPTRQTASSQDRQPQNLNLKPKPRPKHAGLSPATTTLPPNRSATAIPKHPFSKARTTPNPKPTPDQIQTQTAQETSSASYSTPQRGSDQGGDVEDADLDLFSEQADYASVFKSRPKVAVSPPVIGSSSPERRSPDRRGSAFGSLGEAEHENEVDEQGGGWRWR